MPAMSVQYQHMEGLSHKGRRPKWMDLTYYMDIIHDYLHMDRRSMQIKARHNELVMARVLFAHLARMNARSIRHIASNINVSPATVHYYLQKDSIVWDGIGYQIASIIASINQQNVGAPTISDHNPCPPIQ